MEIALNFLEKNYRIEKELGRGGMGIVYLATDKRLDRRVAIKALNLAPMNNAGSSSSEVVERFQREAKAVAKLSHSNIVSIYDVGYEEDIYYMIMEFVDGKDLAGIASEGGMPPDQVINIAIQVCSALDFAHENTIIHRDIKPANIILSKKGVAKLMDFGIAQLNQDDSYKLTQAGSVLGSILYISPEQLNNASEVDARADIFSLGVSLYELLTGKLPFMADNISKIVMKILSEDPLPPSTYSNEIPPELDYIIMKTLAKDPAARYQSAGELAMALSVLIPGGVSVNFSSVIPQGIAPLRGTGTLDDTLPNIKMPDDQNAGEYGATVVVNNANMLTVLSETIMAKKTAINENLIKILETDFAWFPEIFKTWETQDFSGECPDEVMEKLLSSADSKPVSGILQIDNCYTFLNEGYFIGAVDILENQFNDEAFAYIPENPETIKLFLADEQNRSVPAVISSIFSNEKPFHLNLDSASVDLLPLVESFYSPVSPFTGIVKCYTEANIFYYGFSSGEQVFACPANDEDESVSTEVYSDLKILVRAKGVILNTYKVNPSLAGPSVKYLLRNSTVFIRYKNHNKGTLQSIAELNNDEIPSFLLKEVKQNLYLELETEAPAKLKIFDKELDLRKLIQESAQYRFVEWLINDYLYLLNNTGNAVTMKNIFTLVPAIEQIKFHEKLPGEAGSEFEYQMLFYGQLKGSSAKNLLFAASFGSGEKFGIDSFINNSTSVKKNLLKSGDLAGVFYISVNEYPKEALQLYNEHVPEPKKGFAILDASAKFKGFIKIGFNKGYHVSLVQYNRSNNSFKITAPSLNN